MTEVLDFIEKKTFETRYNYYLSNIKEKGCLLYDKTKFYLNGNIITRKGRRINLDDYKVEFVGQSMHLIKKEINKLKKIGSSILSIHPYYKHNSGYWKNVFHGEFVISINIDRDVILTLLSNMHKSYLPRW